MMRYARIPEVPVDRKPLGRHIRHDPRSLAYQVAAADVSTLASVRHTRHIPVLDQGSLGSCTGNAALGAVGTSPLFEAVHGAEDWPPENPDEAENLAVNLYGLATALDDYEGEWPPTDTGSDGLSVAKACQKSGLISGYRHAISLDATLTALANVPVIAGINWYSTFDEPSAAGGISIGCGATVRGGHEICLDELDVERQRVWFTNSWGTSWGVQGRAWMSWATFKQLLEEDGDVTVFVAATEPAPTPTPPAPADPWDQIIAYLRKLIPGLDAWLKKHGL